MVIIITIIFVLSHHITNVIITIHINKVLVEDGRATGVEIDRFSFIDDNLAFEIPPCQVWGKIEA